jgi:uncharacterized protein
LSYFDSAYIAKFYVDEPDSDAIRRLAESLGRVHCSAIGRIEVAAVFHRKLREGAFSSRAHGEVMSQFADDCAHGLWTWLPVTAGLVETTAAAFAGVPRAVCLRATDALHLASAREHGIEDVYTSDRHMSRAAPHFGVRPLTAPPM